MAKTKDENAIVGVFQGTSRGFGFVTPEGGRDRADDYFIPPRATGGAWSGDRVAISPDRAGPFDGDRRSAKITAVLERANKTVTGTLRRFEREFWLQPDSDKLPGPIKLTGKTRGLRSGEKAAVELQSYGGNGKPPLGALRETFGRAGTREAATAAILYNYEIDRAFPANVLEQAEAAPETVQPEALAGRLDLREKRVITIDGASAKDLDDAVSLERDEAGNWVLGVHIADVSHYVTEKSPLDLEAWERGTSVYFADQVIPMLPVELSNGICSLNPRVDRLALTCLMTMGVDGEVLSHSVHKSVIRTTERMTYEDCNLLLDALDGEESPALRAQKGELEARYAHILPMLRDMAALAKVLEKRRRLRGSLDLDTSESYIICDEQGRPVDIRTRKQGESEALIESFMLAANETVAQHLFEREKPGVYRVHEKPSADKAEGLKTMLEPFGYTFQEADSFTLQKILEDAKTRPEAPIISTMVLRSLMKARYDTQNLGHFGLAAKYYCHFTSPIRRYPDLMVHRILTKVIEDEEKRGGAREQGTKAGVEPGAQPSNGRGRVTAQSQDLGPVAEGAQRDRENPANRGRTMPWEKRMAVAAQKAAVQSSEREIAAQNAEREIEKLYMAEYMEAHIGEELTGAVSGVTKFGLFIMLPSGVEGLLPAEALPVDDWHYDEKRMTLRGEHTGRVFSFGMSLEVVCVQADPGSGQIDFRLAGEGESLAIPPRERRHETPMASTDVKGKPRTKAGGRRARPPRHKAGKGGRRKR